MRRLIVSVLLVSFVLSAPRRADAAIGAFFDWLQELSGPGDFTGIGFQAGLLCQGTPIVPRGQTGSAAQSSSSNEATPEWRLCYGLDKRKPIGEWSVVFSRLNTSRNPYPYPQALVAVDSDVHATRLGLASDYTLPFLANRPAWLRAVTVGAGVGGIRFSGDWFDSFWAYYLEIPRVGFKPLAPLACRPAGVCPANWTWWDAVDLTFRTTVIGSVSPVEDFGALRGDPTGAHVQATVTAGFTVSF